MDSLTDGTANKNSCKRPIQYVYSWNRQLVRAVDC